MIAGMISNQKVDPIVTELFIRGKKNLLQMHIFFWLMIQLYHQMILEDLEKFFWKKYIKNHDNWWSD